MATIEDVARAAGVSKGTVSSVFSKKRPISKEVTERVLEAARGLNYKPNYWARSLASRSTRIIGLNIRGEPYRFGPFHLALMNGVLRVCYEHGYRLLVNTLSPDYLSQVENLASDPVDGEIILDPSAKGDARIEDRLASGTPLVVIGRPSAEHEAKVSYVDHDNAGLAAGVTRCLLELGHRDILFLNAPELRTVAEDRAHGYREAYRKAGLEPPPQRLLHKPERGLSSHQFGFDAASAMLERHPAITAVIADNEMMALGVYKAAESLGLSIPGELSVFAFSDDAVLFPELSPPLAGVRQHAEQLGMEAAAMLIEQLRSGNSAARRTLVPAELVPRASCSAPAVSPQSV
ncbi:LacI family DNA-binding transcriptional regulator [Paenibacillus sp. B01]|uniref:LacI family DNA-binding transcriptional regulator n=1 Tax=Paenibacillus sp. B01 TaxID=2660554 RepID=UPI00129B6EED|nr:LacI family DNA-binding transcriptional regulator [Paenibacillus sp. B01]QGG57018.1 LacI family DNA-binding transcriptional regulator [Paenibacillus sp. B01]